LTVISVIAKRFIHVRNALGCEKEMKLGGCAVRLFLWSARIGEFKIRD
jgi:hypothetical protein